MFLVAAFAFAFVLGFTVARLLGLALEREARRVIAFANDCNNNRRA